MLPNTVDTRNGLQFNRGVDQWLAQEYVSGVDKVESRRLCFSVQEEALDLSRVSGTARGMSRIAVTHRRLTLKALHTIELVKARERYAEMLECPAKYFEELFELREHDGLGSHIILSDP